MQKANTRLIKEKNQLERYYLYSNEQFFLRFDIQNNLLENFSSLNAITKNDLRAKNLRILERNNLLIDENKNKRRFQSAFLQMRNSSNPSDSTESTCSLSDSRQRSPASVPDEGVSAAGEPKESADQVEAQKLNFKVLFFLSQIKKRFGIKKLNRKSLFANREFLDFMFQLEKGAELKREITKLQFEVDFLSGIGRPGFGFFAGDRSKTKNDASSKKGPCPRETATKRT